jgi:microcystin degradation protein MlrC
MARIAVGGFQHETNTFSPQLTTWADFERADGGRALSAGPS